jgi:hypothetical protein
MNIHRLWRSSPVSAILALAVMLLFAGVPGHSLAGAQSASPQDKPLQHEVGVSFKLVQVYVTAKGGRAVGDLTAEDFTITDNGKPQQVAHFERHFLGTEASPAEPSITLPTNRKFFLIFDFAFMDSRGVLKSKDAALKFLDTEMRPTDEIGLITYSANRGLVLHEYLTSDHGRIRKIVEGFGLGHFTGRAERLTDFLYAAGLDKSEESGMAWSSKPRASRTPRPGSTRTRPASRPASACWTAPGRATWTGPGRTSPPCASWPRSSA